MDSYIVLNGPINFDVTSRLISVYTRMLTARITNCHLLIDSIGGDIPSTAFELLRHGKTNVITYNMGSIQSSAVMIYCSGTMRRATCSSHFMVHQVRHVHGAGANFTKNDAEVLLRYLDIDNKRMLTALQTAYTVDLEAYWKSDTHYTGDQAKCIGLVTEISDFSPPPGNPYSLI